MRHLEIFPIIHYEISTRDNGVNVYNEDDIRLLQSLCEDNKGMLETDTEKDFIEKVISDYENIFVANKPEAE
jgi:hypothetical protein